MRLSKSLVPTLREEPAEAEALSHKLMLRAGLVRQLAAGIYVYLPLGQRVLDKVNAIIREEMNAIGGQEITMPVMHPAEIWKQSGRWDNIPEMFKLKDRKGADMCLGMTHEEVVAWLAAREIRSYRDLPQIWYQIQTKERDEARPRSGVLRTREFLMKDSYTLDPDLAALDRSYAAHESAYRKIFERCGLRFHVVQSDTGMMGGLGSHEFMAPSAAGEDEIALCAGCDYAANVELAEALSPGARPAAKEAMRKVPTPGMTKCEQVAELLKLPLARTVKAIAVMHDEQLVLLLIRGDHELNEIKSQKLIGVFRFAGEAEIRRHLGTAAGYLGPVGAKVRVVADRTVAAMADFVCGANEAGFHLAGVNWGRDTPEPEVADIRNVVPGDPSPDGRGKLDIVRGIEVGHIFQLRTKYSEAMGAAFLDEKGATRPFEMGCYGIGVTRIVGAAIEQNHDARGIIFPAAIAPFQACIVPIGYHKSQAVRSAADEMYAQLCSLGVDVLLEDREERPGVLFADMDLIGIPHRVVIGERGLAAGNAEYKARRDEKASDLPLADVVSLLQQKLA
jgi:prolyl-tRNA synthetase